MKIAIVILNWNGKKILEQFLPSVVEFSEEATIYVADNASTDKSIPYLKEKFSKVTIIQNKTNGGYAKGYNDALKNVTEDLLVLLNNDVEVTQNWLQPIINEFKRDNSLIAAQPKILDFNNKRYFEYAGAGGGFIDQLGYPYCRGRIFNTIEKDKGQYNDIKKIFWASGACFIVRSNEFKELNGFDENFFTHQEEIDLCWRIQLNGGIIKYIGNSTVYHVGGATLSNINPIKTFYNFRNSLLMLVKNIKSSKVWIILFMRLLMDGIAGIHFLIQGKWKHTLAIVKAHFSFYSLLPRYINKVYKIRKEIKYYHIKSIVWNYFIRKNRIFKELN
ncbi:glycosyltransferase family 2 protein [Flavobacteriaceae bacterium]|jgi:GT2 family glycosyltransferase|nr:glycosyltransferase family 2 protein [Flavobacteriaceae bacterium]